MEMGRMCPLKMSARSALFSIVLVVLRLVTSDLVFAQNGLTGVIDCKRTCDDNIKVYKVELIKNNEIITATELDGSKEYLFFRVIPEDGMLVSWIKERPSPDGIYPLKLVVKHGRIDGAFQFRTADDIYLLHKLHTIDKIQSKNSEVAVNSFSDFLALKCKQVQYDQNIYYSMLKELDYQTTHMLRNSHGSTTPALFIDNAREIKRATLELLSSNEPIDNKTAKIVAQIKSWIEFARVIYREKRRNFAKEPTSINAATDKNKFFCKSDRQEQFTEDLQHIMEVVSVDDIRQELLDALSRLVEQGKLDTKSYPIEKFKVIINRDVDVEDVDMSVLSYYINALYDPKAAS